MAEVQDWNTAAEDLLPDMIALRRAIHAEPEIGLDNPKTTAKILDALKGLPLELHIGPSTTGVVAVLKGPENGRRVLLRGDMDALPLNEDTGLPFSSSVSGAMHACGHDTHVSMLVGAARMMCARREHLAGTVMFMFQPGEEGHHGARFMLEDGLLDPMPDAAFALHIFPNAPKGVFASRPGPLLASADTFTISVRGRGGHASMPHMALDPIPIACEIVGAIQTYVTRQVPIFDPAVITVAKIEAGTTDNVIPETAFMLGTIRTLSKSTRDAVQVGLKRLAEGIAAAYGATADVAVTEGFPVTVCDSRAVATARDAIQALYGPEAWVDQPSPVMGAEDFSYVLEKTPGAMMFLGAAPDGQDWRSCCPLHSNRLVLDESVMARGAAAHAAVGERFLAEGFSAG
jgi:amidohydrolase